MARLFEAADRRLYLVGGIVRDLWLDTPVDPASDIDLTTDARPAEIKSLLRDWADALWTQGERFGTIGVKRQQRSFEVTTHRAEAYRADSRKPEVVFGDDVHVDLSRRDFTVNAMAIDVTHTATDPAMLLVDPFGGAEDLTARRLRTPLAPTTSFSDDPLRILRAARFANKYQLEPVGDLMAAATDLRHRLDIVSKERIRDELEKFLDAPDVRRGFAFLTASRVIDVVLPIATPASVAVAEGAGPPWWLRLAGIFAELDLPADDATTQLRELRCSAATTRQVRNVLNGLPIPSDPTPESVRRWVLRVEPYEAECFVLAAALVAENDVEADAAASAVSTFHDAWAALAEVEDLRDDGVPLKGDAIADLLGVAPGPEIGQAVNVLKAHRLRHGPFGPDDARVVLLDWSRARRSDGEC